MTRRHDSPREHAVPGRFAGQTAIVTGSTRGIGAGIAERLAAEGANVVVSGRSEDAGEAVVERIDEATGGDAGDAVFVRADMRDPDDIAALFEATADEFGRLDVLVNNAGVKQLTLAGEQHRVQDVPVDLWETVIDTNLTGTFLFSRTALPGMLDRDAGRIIHVTSGHGKHGRVERAPYVASKHGAEGFHKTLSLELADCGVDSLVFTPPDGGVHTREAQFTDSPMAHDADVVREPMIRLAAGEGENGGRYRGTEDGQGFEETHMVEAD